MGEVRAQTDAAFDAREAHTLIMRALSQKQE
jgi:hypothetical protein